MLLTLDQILFEKIYKAANKHLEVSKIMVRITKWSSKILMGIYCSMLGILYLQRNPKIIPVLLAPAFVLILVKLLRSFFHRPRPFVTLNIESLIRHKADSSFPSKHAASAFVIGIAVWCIEPTIGQYVLWLAAATGLSRVMVGVHYPLDVLIGAALGSGIGLLVFQIILNSQLYGLVHL